MMQQIRDSFRQYHMLDVHDVRRYGITDIEMKNSSGVLSIFLSGPWSKVNINGSLHQKPPIRVTVIGNWVGIRTIGRGCTLFDIADTARQELKRHTLMVAESLHQHGFYVRYNE